MKRGKGTRRRPQRPKDAKKCQFYLNKKKGKEKPLLFIEKKGFFYTKRHSGW